MTQTSLNSLIQKYNIPGPRYTSYPTVPAWKEDSVNKESWIKHVKSTFDITNKENGISIYIHLPYCESLCTYCGCNTRITINHSVEEPYIATVLAEWEMYLAIFEDKPQISEIHLGGGTPTFFSPQNLTKLINGIKALSIVRQDAALSFEAHPGNTTKAHLQTLFDLGFKRLSLGIQDFDLEVQKTIHRIQTYETVELVVNQARSIGYTSINFDLIYGLPKQTADTIRDTFEKVAILKPDRIAYYSYAHVPWVKPGQRSFTEKDLPANEVKRQLYELGKEMLSDIDYHEVGMDHFSLASDELYIASQTGSLHRNFMGYTTLQSELVVGLGVSSIGDTGTAYGQNLKKVEDYKATVLKGELPIYRGHNLTKEEMFVRKQIADIMCKFETSCEESDPYFSLFEEGLGRLTEMQIDGLIYISDNKVHVTEEGKPFVRNAAMAFDIHFWNQESNKDKEVFSSTI
ncbi:MAG: oxygen-independent coproporphyrinogen III oxidase [Reichenbachiella sp.]